MNINLGDEHTHEHTHEVAKSPQCMQLALQALFQSCNSQRASYKQEGESNHLLSAGLLVPCRWLELYAALDLRLSASFSPKILAVLPAGAFLPAAAAPPLAPAGDYHIKHPGSVY